MGTPAKKIAFHTLGCKLNFSETSTLARDSLKFGYENVNSKDFADIYVFNTCSVTENANKETRKLVRRSKRLNPNAFIALIGCYAQLKPKELIELEDVNLVLGATDKFDLLKHLDEINILGNKKLSCVLSFLTISISFSICLNSCFLGFGFGLIILFDIFSDFNALSKNGFFNGITVNSAAKILEVNSKINVNIFIKKIFFLSIIFTK